MRASLVLSSVFPCLPVAGVTLCVCACVQTSLCGQESCPGPHHASSLSGHIPALSGLGSWSSSFSKGPGEPPSLPTQPVPALSAFPTHSPQLPMDLWVDLSLPVTLSLDEAFSLMESLGVLTAERTILVLAARERTNPGSGVLGSLLHMPRAHDTSPFHRRGQAQGCAAVAPSDQHRARDQQTHKSSCPNKQDSRGAGRTLCRVHSN